MQEGVVGAEVEEAVPGYGVRILPMSSTAHTIVYFQLMCEVAERMNWK